MAIPLWIIVMLPIAKNQSRRSLVDRVPADPAGCSVPESSSAPSSDAAIWRLGELSGLPGVPHEPGIFVVVAMMACFGSVARAPLAIMIMVAEMTGSFSVVPGAILAVGIASLLMSRTNVTIYEAQRLIARPPRPNARVKRPTRTRATPCAPDRPVASVTHRRFIC